MIPLRNRMNEVNLINMKQLFAMWNEDLSSFRLYKMLPFLSLEIIIAEAMFREMLYLKKLHARSSIFIMAVVDIKVDLFGHNL